jgi:hypothetical protein
VSVGFVLVVVLVSLQTVSGVEHEDVISLVLLKYGKETINIDYTLPTILIKRQARGTRSKCSHDLQDEFSKFNSSFFLQIGFAPDDAVFPPSSCVRQFFWLPFIQETFIRGNK